MITPELVYELRAIENYCCPACDGSAKQGEKCQRSSGFQGHRPKSVFQAMRLNRGNCCPRSFNETFRVQDQCCGLCKHDDSVDSPDSYRKSKKNVFERLTRRVKDVFGDGLSYY